MAPGRKRRCQCRIRKPAASAGNLTVETAAAPVVEPLISPSQLAVLTAAAVVAAVAGCRRLS